MEKLMATRLNPIDFGEYNWVESYEMDYEHDLEDETLNDIAERYAEEFGGRILTDDESPLGLIHDQRGLILVFDEDKDSPYYNMIWVESVPA